MGKDETVAAAGVWHVEKPSHPGLNRIFGERMKGTGSHAITSPCPGLRFRGARTLSGFESHSPASPSNAVRLDLPGRNAVTLQISSNEAARSELPYRGKADRGYNPWPKGWRSVRAWL